MVPRRTDRQRQSVRYQGERPWRTLRNLTDRLLDATGDTARPSRDLPQSRSGMYHARRDTSGHSRAAAIE